MTVVSGTISVAACVVYITYIDFMNYMGHCNFEFVTNRLFTFFPLLKVPHLYSIVSLVHHTQFRTNYSLFMAFYDYVYGTPDKSSDALYQKSPEREEDVADVVHLTHLTTPESIFHLRLGSAALAYRPLTSTWYLCLLSPITKLLTWIYGRTFVVESNQFEKLKMQTWVIPKFNVQVVRKDCFYHCTPAMKAPPSLQNLHSCENWLPMRLMSAWRIAGVVHAMEGLTEHECGYAMSDIDRVWKATLRHGFQPLHTPIA